MFCGTDSIPQNIPLIQTECEEYKRIFHRILSVPENIVMDIKHKVPSVSFNNKENSQTTGQGRRCTSSALSNFKEMALQRSANSSRFICCSQGRQ